MKKEDKIALKIIKKKFTLEEWESFPSELKNNPIILTNISKIIADVPLEKKNNIIHKNPQLLKYLPDSEQEVLANKNNFSYLSHEVQNKLISQNNKIIMFASDEIKKEIIKSNPEAISLLTCEDQVKLIEENKFLISMAKQEVQTKMAKNDPYLLSLCSEKTQCFFVKENPKYFKNCSIHVQRELLTLKMLDYTKLDTDTLNSYLLAKSPNVDIDELVELKTKIASSSRLDKNEFDEYLSYLIASYKKNKLLD